MLVAAHNYVRQIFHVVEYFAQFLQLQEIEYYICFMKHCMIQMFADTPKHFFVVVDIYFHKDS